MATALHQLSPDSFKGFLDFLIYKKHSFTLTSTGYSHSIEWNNQKYLFTYDKANPYLFACYNRIKNNAMKMQAVIDTVPRFDISYYCVNDYLRKPQAELPTEILNVDINSAYVTALLNANIIDKPTFEYICKAPKMIRLKSVGMLATQKTVFNFNNGEPIGEPEFITDQQLRNYFLYACYVIGEIMKQLKKHFNEQFLFFWFDGIYLSPDADVNKVTEILKEGGYNSKVQLLSECKFESTDRGINFSYLKKENRTSFFIPFEDSENRANIKAYLKSITKK